MNHENNVCEYDDRRDELFVAYLYDEGSGSAGSVDGAAAGERALFAAHLATCAVCRRELAELRAVRRELAAWTPPQPLGPLTTWTTTPAASAATSPRRVWDRLAQMPAWAQVAAALLVLAVSARVANFQVRYDASGLSVRTGWQTTAQPATTLTSAPEPAGAAWRADLTALEERLRAELRTAGQMQASSSAAVPGDVLQRVRRLIEESERRQQREIALRVAEVRNEIEAQRQADLVRIDRSQRALQQETGFEMQRNRQMMNYIVRTSQTSQR
jgi:hypothetical protein